MNYNVVHLTDKTIQGTLFDRFGRNNFLDSEIFTFDNILIDDVDENDSRNLILIDLVGSMEGQEWTLLSITHQKLKSY